MQERLRTLVLREFYGYPGLQPEKKNFAVRLLLKILLLPYYLWHKKHIGTVRCRGEGKVLDIGCGASRHLARLKRHGWDVYGIDISERAAQMAREGFGLEVVQGDILEHQFPELVGLINFFQALFRISDNIEVHAEKDNTLSEGLTKEIVR